MVRKHSEIKKKKWVCSQSIYYLRKIYSLYSFLLLIFQFLKWNFGGFTLFYHFLGRKCEDKCIWKQICSKERAIKSKYWLVFHYFRKQKRNSIRFRAHVCDGSLIKILHHNETKSVLFCGSLEICICLLPYYLFTIWPWASHLTSLVWTFFLWTIRDTTTTNDKIMLLIRSVDIYWAHDKHCVKCLHMCLILFSQKPLIQVFKFPFYRVGISVKRLLVSSPTQSNPIDLYNKENWLFPIIRSLELC